jgi:hypothetical protein
MRKEIMKIDERELNERGLIKLVKATLNLSGRRAASYASFRIFFLSFDLKVLPTSSPSR